MNEKYMKLAYELAGKGLGKCAPNPCVGAVIVRGGRVLAEGWHKKFGGDHAEIVALKSVKDGVSVKGAEMYVTLEPCCHTGKTGPCVDAILSSGIGRVFIGMEDPFGKVSGKGIKGLRGGGVKVEMLDKKSELYGEIVDLNKGYLKFVKTGLPYVVMKAGMSLDGKIATGSGESKWITGEEARKDAGVERAKCDAVVVGAGTVLADDPSLGDGLRVVLDGSRKIKNENYKVFRDDNYLVIEKKVRILGLLKDLGRRGILSVFVEGGSEVHGAFYDAELKNGGVVDEVIFYVAPKIIGGKGLSVVGGKGVSKLVKAKKFSFGGIERVGEDLKIKVLKQLYPLPRRPWRLGRLCCRRRSLGRGVCRCRL